MMSKPSVIVILVAGEYKPLQIVLQAHLVEILMVGAKPLSCEGQKVCSEYYNYFNGAKENWAEHVPAFEEVLMEEVYPGIDFRFYSKNGHFKYDFIAKKGSDPSQIKMQYEGVESLGLERHRLNIKTSVREFVEQEPYAFQVIDGKEKQVVCEFVKEGSVISFDFPESFEVGEELVIDPELVFSTYSGSFADNWGFTATFGANGSVYTAGQVRDLGNDGFNFPATPGAFQVAYQGNNDMGILKFDSLGQNLLYATYLGGTGAEVPHSLIVNDDDELFILGTSGSFDFPTSIGAFDRIFNGGSSALPLGGILYQAGSDIVVCKLSADGSQLLGSTFLGGSENDGIMVQFDPLVQNYGDQFRGEIILDENDNVLIATNTSSPDFPIVNGFQNTYGGGLTDGVIVKLNESLSQVLWSSFHGGDDQDAAYSVKLDSEENVFVGGGTVSDNFIGTSTALHSDRIGNIDGYLTRIEQTGNVPTISASTFLGTFQDDQAYLVQVDTFDIVYALGQTDGPYPVTPDVFSNPNSGQFVQALSNDLSQDVFSTVVGSGTGSPNISPTAFLVNECGNIFISGWGGAVNTDFAGGASTGYNGGNTFGLPITTNANQSQTDGSDFYLMVLSRDRQTLLFATYFGGTNGNNEHVDGGTSRFDERGIAYQAVCAGCGGNSDFPTTPGAWSNTNNSPNCNNAVFVFDLASLDANFEIREPANDFELFQSGCNPSEVVFRNLSQGGINFLWDFGDGTTSTQEDNVFHTYTQEGTFTVTLTAVDENTCQVMDVATQQVQIFSGSLTLPEDTIMCQNEPIQLIASGAANYVWEPAEGLSNPFIANPIADPDQTTTYVVSATNQFGCNFRDSLTVEVIPTIVTEFTQDFEFGCTSSPTISFINNSINAQEFLWDFGDGTTSSEINPIHTYEEAGVFTVSLRSVASICSDEQVSVFNIVETFIPNVFTPNTEVDDINSFFEVLSSGDNLELEVYNRFGEQVFQSKNYQNDWDASNVSSGVYFYLVRFQDQTECSGWVSILK